MSEWRDSRAGTYDDFAVQFGELLKRLEDAEAMLEELREDKLLVETRSYAGGIKALRTTLTGRARDLRRHQDVDVLPMGYTTRRVG